MSREAFESHVRRYHYPLDRRGEGYSDRMTQTHWETWQAATEHAQQWTPYKEGDCVEDGEYLVQFQNGEMQVAERDDADWLDDEGDKIAGIFVVAYRSLPAPYGGE